MNTATADCLETGGRAEAGPTFRRPSSGLTLAGVLDSMRRFTTVSEALRVLGATVLLASMSLFLLQSWDEGNDIRRYLMLLAQTGLLAAGGFALSHGLQEAKGARLFFGLALVSVPANFTILGALIYSLFQWDGALTTYPAFATWQLQDAASIGVTIAGALLVLLPVTLFAFAIMARHSAKTLSLHFIAINALLLLPVRGSLFAGLLALFAVAYALAIVRKASNTNGALRTAEGRFALSALFIPAGIILVRSLYLYGAGSLVLAVVALAAFLALRQASTLPGRSAAVAVGLELLSAPFALGFACALTDAYASAFGSAYAAAVFSLGYALPALDLARRTKSRVLTGFLSVSISLLVSISFVLSVAGSPNALQAFLCVLGGSLLLAGGLTLRSTMASVSGVITVLAGLSFGFDAMFDLVLASSWVDLAIFGAVAIVVGSVLDRHGVAVKLKFRQSVDMLRKRPRAIALDD